MFVDKVRIHIKAGNGGNGAVSFRREKYVSHGGPDGGDGGHGGNIVFRVDPGCNTLLAFRYKHKFVAQNGENGSGAKFHGATADDLVILVPPGTVIRDFESGQVIHDMSADDGADFIGCKGGRGGFGNRHFSTPTRQVPMFAKNGTEGQERDVTLELIMIADVGLIGYPSVGKSSLLASISSAKPKVADYHFTTLSPNLGVVSTGGESGFVAADIPGLIEGAADGAGLGHEFLRHIERCRLLLHVVDIAATEGRDPIEDVKKIDEELKKYSEELASRPQIILANKWDCIRSSETDIDAFSDFVHSTGREWMPVSAMTGEGLDEMISLVSERLKALPPITVFEPEYVEETMDETAYRETTVRRQNDTFYVEGEWLKKLLGNINYDDYESLNYLQNVLRKEGVFDLLQQKGCVDGHTVNIYDYEFEYVQ